MFLKPRIHGTIFVPRRECVFCLTSRETASRQGPHTTPAHGGSMWPDPYPIVIQCGVTSSPCSTSATADQQGCSCSRCQPQMSEILYFQFCK